MFQTVEPVKSTNWKVLELLQTPAWNIPQVAAFINKYGVDTNVTLDLYRFKRGELTLIEFSPLKVQETVQANLTDPINEYHKNPDWRKTGPCYRQRFLLNGEEKKR